MLTQFVFFFSSPFERSSNARYKWNGAHFSSSRFMIRTLWTVWLIPLIRFFFFISITPSLLLLIFMNVWVKQSALILSNKWLMAPKYVHLIHWILHNFQCIRSVSFDLWINFFLFQPLFIEIEWLNETKCKKKNSENLHKCSLLFGITREMNLLPFAYVNEVSSMLYLIFPNGWSCF